MTTDIAVSPTNGRLHVAVYCLRVAALVILLMAVLILVNRCVVGSASPGVAAFLAGCYILFLELISWGIRRKSHVAWAAAVLLFANWILSPASSVALSCDLPIFRLKEPVFFFIGLLGFWSLIFKGSIVAMELHKR